MKTNSKKVVIIALIVALLIIGIGYAVISSTALKIDGSATASPNDKNFQVKFSGVPTVSNTDNVSATITDDLDATIEVKGLTAKGDIATATYTIENASPDLTADIVANVSKNTNEEYFSVTTDMTSTVSVTAGNTTTITVTVELIKTPVTADESTTIQVDLTASPKQA